MPPLVNSDLSYFRGRHVLLTGVGGAGQTGEIIAREFALQGAVMLLADRSRNTCDERVADLAKDGFEAHGFACDLSVEGDVAKLALDVAAVCGESGLVALVNAAGGFAASGNVAESNLESWRKQHEINLTTCYLTTRAMLPLLRLGTGSVVNFTTGAVQTGQSVAGMSAYVSAKSGVAVLTRAVAQEERDNGVRANAVAPSAIRTAANLNTMGSRVRYVEREEVARTVLFLCSPAAAAVSGEIVRLA
jgi:NAD(P)-dependent dehydrogenase (short-subunit alcohol dehydrogenase family)